MLNQEKRADHLIARIQWAQEKLKKLGDGSSPTVQDALLFLQLLDGAQQ